MTPVPTSERPAGRRRAPGPTAVRAACLKAVVASAVLLFVAPVPGGATHGDGVFDLPATDLRWDTFRLDVLVVPPAHGPLSQGGEPASANNSYRQAIFQAAAAWREAIDEYGAPWLAQNLTWTVHVLGDAAVPPEVLADPEILVVHSEVGSFGFATHTRNLCEHYAPCPDGPTCVIHAGPLPAVKEEAADVHNVHAHELGHCLGVGHPGDGRDPATYHPDEDLMSYGQKPFPLHCVSNLDVLAAEAAFAHLTGVEAPPVATLNVSDYEQLDCNERGQRFRFGEEPPEDTPPDKPREGTASLGAAAAAVAILACTCLRRRRP